MDAGYKTPWICKKIIDDGRIPVLPYKRPMGAKGFFRPYEYVYDEYYNCVICPENKVLNYSKAKDISVKNVRQEADVQTTQNLKRL